MRRSAGLLCLALGVAALGFYVVLYPVRGLQVPIGADTPVYIWWARYAGAEGIGAFRTGSRAGIVGLMATLSAVSGASVAAVAAAIGPVLATTLGLATGALVDGCLGRNRVRFALVAVLTGAFLSIMAAGYFSTVAFGALFLAALACLANAIDGSGRGAVMAAAALLAAAVLAHPLFVPLAAAILAGAALGLAPSWRRDRALGVPVQKTGVGAVGLASLGAAGLAAAALAAVHIGPDRHVIDTSRDALLRRKPLGELLEGSFRRKLRHDFPWYRAATVVGLALVPAVLRPTAPSPPVGPQRTDRTRFFAGAMVAWLTVSIAGVVLLAWGVEVPGQRLAAFCVPLPVFAAIGVRRIYDRLDRRPAAVRMGVVAAPVALFLVVAWMAWQQETTLVPPRAVAQARGLAGVLAREPLARPVVVVMDNRSDKPSLFVIRFANHLRDELPARRIDDAYVFVGTPQDFLAGRRTLIGQQEHDRLVWDYWRIVRRVIPRRPLAVVVEAFDPGGYRSAVEIEGTRRLSPGVVALPGFGPSRALESGGPPDQGDLGAGLLSPWTPVWLAPVLLAFLAAVGWPWARSALTAADPLARLALSPAFGAAAVSLASIVADSVGLRLSGAGGWVAVGAALAGGLAVLAYRRRLDRRGVDDQGPIDPVGQLGKSRQFQQQ